MGKFLHISLSNEEFEQVKEIDPTNYTKAVRQALAAHKREQARGDKNSVVIDNQVYRIVIGDGRVFVLSGTVMDAGKEQADV